MKPWIRRWNRERDKVLNINTRRVELGDIGTRRIEIKIADGEIHFRLEIIIEGRTEIFIEILAEVEMIDTMKNDIGTNGTEMNDILVTVIGEIDTGMNDTQMIDIGMIDTEKIDIEIIDTRMID